MTKKIKPLTVEILKGKVRAKDFAGNIYNIEGVEITREDMSKEVYNTDTAFYKAIAAVGILSECKMLDDNSIMLL